MVQDKKNNRKFFMTIGIIVLLSVIILKSAHVPENSIQNINFIPNVKSALPIDVKSAIDSEGRIHIVWGNDALGINYQRSIDDAKNWSAPEKISEYGMKDIYLFFVNDELVLLRWVYLGDGWNGVEYSSLKNNNWTIFKKHKIFKNFKTSLLCAAAEQEKIHIFFTTEDGDIYYVHGKYNGCWEPPQKIYESFKYQDVLEYEKVSDFSCNVEGENIYSIGKFVTQILDKKEKAQPTYRQSISVLLIKSADAGKTWSEPIKVLEQENISRVQMTSKNNTLYLVYSLSDTKKAKNGDNLFFQYSDDKGNSWSRGEKILDSSLDYSAIPEPIITVDSSMMVHLVYRDVRHKVRKWWSFLPVFTDADPFKANNDLYYMSFNKNSLPQKEEIRLTNQMSYTDRYSLICKDKKCYIFWTGIEKVGNTWNEYGLPWKIFYAFVDNK